MTKVYLSGPMSGLSVSEANSWRDLAKAELESLSIQTLNPVRGKEFDSVIPQSSQEHISSHVTPNTVIRRDHYDVHSSDVLLVNFLNTDRVSIGTVCEVAWAYHKHIPVVMVIESDNIHNHYFMEAAATFITDDFTAALDYIKVLLKPHV